MRDLSKAIFETQSGFLMLAYKEIGTVKRPGGQFYTEHLFPLRYLDTGYRPMVLGFYTDSLGNTLQMPSSYNGTVNPFDLTDDALPTLSAYNNQISVGVYGKTADPNTYTMSIELLVLINSILEA